MNISTMDYQKLIQAAKALHYIKDNRQGGLLITEQTALDNLEKELAGWGWFWSNEIRHYVYVN